MELSSLLTGGGVAAAVAVVILGLIKAVDTYRKTGSTKENDLVTQLHELNAAESTRNTVLTDKLDALRGRFDDAVEQNAKLRVLLIQHSIEIPIGLADAP
jgi:hypothetical protein